MAWKIVPPGTFSPSYRNVMIEAWASGSAVVHNQLDPAHWRNEFSRFKKCIREFPDYDSRLTMIEATTLFRCHPKGTAITVTARDNIVSWLSTINSDLIQSIDY